MDRRILAGRIGSIEQSQEEEAESRGWGMNEFGEFWPRDP